jgi:carbamoyltransferase
MGLCAYGQIKNEWIEPLKKFYITNNSSKLGRDINLNLSYNALSGQSGYDLAATSQKVFEEYVHALLTSVLNRFNHDIILVGGCALNVLSNQKIYSWLKNNKPNIKLYVPPNPNDCGLALGQFLTDHPEAVKKANTYCGWDILDKDKFTNYIEERKATPVTITEIVNLIKSGKIIGIIDGCSEVGPRALGNRSIICDPTLSDMKDVLNLKVKFREWYRPFAPVCRLEDKDLYFEEAPEAVYMSYAPKVKEEYRNVLKAITHIDNTSRLQTVTEKQHKLFYNILTELKNRNQIAVILNTSFNIRGKPILTTLQDALYVLDNTQLDYVTSNGFLFKKQL